MFSIYDNGLQIGAFFCLIIANHHRHTGMVYTMFNHVNTKSIMFFNGDFLSIYSESIGIVAVHPRYKLFHSGSQAGPRCQLCFPHQL